MRLWFGWLDDESVTDYTKVVKRHAVVVVVARRWGGGRTCRGTGHGEMASDTLQQVDGRWVYVESEKNGILSTRGCYPPGWSDVGARRGRSRAWSGGEWQGGQLLRLSCEQNRRVE